MVPYLSYNSWYILSLLCVCELEPVHCFSVEGVREFGRPHLDPSAQGSQRMSDDTGATMRAEVRKRKGTRKWTDPRSPSNILS